MNPQLTWQASVAEAAFNEMLPVLTGRRRLRDIDRVVDSLHRRAAATQSGLLTRLEQTGGSAPDCVVGCDYCCYVRVHTTVVEAVRIANYLIESKSPTELLAASEQIARFCEELDRLGAADYFLARLPCPLLSDHRCSVHEVRPIPCRAYLSWNVKACYDHFVRNLPGEIPKLEAMPLALGPLATGMARAVLASSAGPEWVSMPHAVRAALVPGALRNWQSGQDLFADCAAPTITLPAN
jgi:hypothetical protein